MAGGRLKHIPTTGAVSSVNACLRQTDIVPKRGDPVNEMTFWLNFRKLCERSSKSNVPR